MMIFQPLLTNEQTTICLDFEKKRFCGLKIEKKKMKYFYVCMNLLKSPMKLITCI